MFHCSSRSSQSGRLIVGEGEVNITHCTQYSGTGPSRVLDVVIKKVVQRTYGATQIEFVYGM